jgi:hypothetical protein
VRALVALALLAACAGHPPPPAEGERAVLFVACPVRDAALWVDGRFVAEIAEVARGLAMPAGRHRIELRHAGFFDYYGVVELAPHERKRLAIELAERLP